MGCCKHQTPIPGHARVSVDGFLCILQIKFLILLPEVVLLNHEYYLNVLCRAYEQATATLPELLNYKCLSDIWMKLVLDTNLFLQEAVLALRRHIIQLERAEKREIIASLSQRHEEVKVCIQRTSCPLAGFFL